MITVRLPQNWGSGGGSPVDANKREIRDEQ